MVKLLLPHQQNSLNKWLLCIMLLPFYSTAQSNYTLETAIQKAIENNTMVKNSKIDEEMALKKVWETTAIGLPQISGEIAFQNFIDIPTTVLPANAFNPAAPEGEMIGLQFGTDYNVNGSLTLTQLIFNGNYLVGLQAARAYSGLSLKKTEKTRAEIKYAVSEIYATCAMLEANKTFVTAALSLLKEMEVQTAILVKESVVEEENLIQLSLSKLELQNAQEQIASQTESALLLLKYQMGVALTESIVLEQTLEDLIILAEFGAFVSAQNLDYQLVENQHQLNVLQLKNTRANYLPTLGGFFSHQQVALRNDLKLFGTTGQWYPTTLWGLNLNIPIFSSGQKAAQVSQALLETKKSENNLADLDMALQLQNKQTLNQISQLNTQLNNQKAAVVLSQKLLSFATIKKNEQSISSLEFIQAQQKLITTQSALVQTQYDLIKAQQQLQKIQNK